MSDNSHLDKLPAWAGTVLWTDRHGNNHAHVITDDEHQELIAKNVEFLLYDRGQLVGYEYKTHVDTDRERNDEKKGKSPSL